MCTAEGPLLIEDAVQILLPDGVEAVTERRVRPDAAAEGQDSASRFGWALAQEFQLGQPCLIPARLLARDGNAEPRDHAEDHRASQWYLQYAALLDPCFIGDGVLPACRQHGHDLRAGYAHDPADRHVPCHSRNSDPQIANDPGNANPVARAR
jgi:hypothetical protein